MWHLSLYRFDTLIDKEKNVVKKITTNILILKKIKNNLYINKLICIIIETAFGKFSI